MRDTQVIALTQAKELLESAKTNPHHMELAKYLVKNMNSIEGAIERGWTIGASEDDTEYMKKYLELRDEYAPVLFADYVTLRGLYHPPYSDESIVDAIKCGYNFGSECGNIIKSMIKFNYGLLSNSHHTERFPTLAKFAGEVLDVLQEVSPD
jgi:hypothetical protein